MAQRVPAPFRLTKDQTAWVMSQLEMRKYGRRLNAEELAQKAGVDLDSVNRVELHLPIDDKEECKRIANALGVTLGLLGKIAGCGEISPDEWRTLQTCLSSPSTDQPEPESCMFVGLHPLHR